MENNNNSKRMLTLMSSDGKEFEVPEVVAKESQMICGMIEDCIITKIPLDNVNAKILTKVLTYCQKHAEEKEKAAAEPQTADGEGSSSVPAASTTSNEDLKEWDKEFVKDAKLSMLYDLLLASNYLIVDGLLHLTAQAVADLIKGKSVEEIRETFGIKGDFTPEEEEEIRKEHEWAYKKEN